MESAFVFQMLVIVLLCLSKVHGDVFFNSFDFTRGDKPSTFDFTRGYEPSTFDLFSYGAIADGITNDTPALLQAWNQACQSPAGGTVTVQEGVFLVDTITFQGPCKGRMVFSVNGQVRALANPKLGTDYWIKFQDVSGLTVSGRGILDGQGPQAWSQNTCDQNLHCPPLPVTLKLESVRGATIQGITSLNSKKFHININNCEDVSIDGVTITAPGNSPNTDGVHIGNSNNIRVTNLRVATGDDCVSIGPGNTNIIVSGVACGPGHGISIGSLGKSPGEGDVSGVIISDCSFTNTENGVRIKTWAPSSPSSVTNVTFQDISMNGAKNPIIIDQYYCPDSLCSHKGEVQSHVQIKNVKFINVRGLSASPVSVNVNCSKSVPCRDLLFEGLDLTSPTGSQNLPTVATCSHAQGIFVGRQQVPSECFDH